MAAIRLARLPRRLRSAATVSCAIAVCALPRPSCAEGLVWATGKVLDANDQPIAGARIAVFDDSDHVVDTARTDSNGDYAVAVPEHVLHLGHGHGGGFVTEVFSGVTRLVSGAAEFVSDPVRAGMHAITDAQAALIADPLTRGEFSAGAFVVDRAVVGMTPRDRRRVPVDERKQPGAILLKVIAPDRSDVIGISHVYWLQHEIVHASTRRVPDLSVWLDPVVLQPAEGETRSQIKSDYLKFAHARIEPSIAERGDSIRIIARLKAPPDPDTTAIVVARDARTGQMWQLEPVGDDRYEAAVLVDRKFPEEDQTISLLAYPRDERHPGRRPVLERTLEHNGAWDLRKPYEYDPLLEVSRDRADLILTVVHTRRGR